MRIIIVCTILAYVYIVQIVILVMMEFLVICNLEIVIASIGHTYIVAIYSWYRYSEGISSIFFLDGTFSIQTIYSELG